MTVVKKCVYTPDGELMAPQPYETSIVHCVGYGGFPTFDIGYYHEFVMNGDGDTYAQAEDDILAKLRRFYAIMNQVEGFSTLAINKHDGWMPGPYRRYKFMYHIVYVVEDTGSPTQDPDNPYPGYRRDMERRKGRGREVPGFPGLMTYG